MLAKNEEVGLRSAVTYLAEFSEEMLLIIMCRVKCRSLGVCSEGIGVGLDWLCYTAATAPTMGTAAVAKAELIMLLLLLLLWVCRKVSHTAIQLRWFIIPGFFLL
jgi:hypothetical protein